MISISSEANGEVKGTIYPNPSNETFKVELSKPSNITVYSLDGQQLLEYKNIGSVVFGEQLKAGVYLVKTGNTFYKIVKE
ncbi:MAG: T9SS type A sorting domain-containing protein [Sporocytophaga sp.]|nr:T9SS type A sorting domain-containing protein [Sporocytophaga sp.]